MTKKTLFLIMAFTLAAITNVFAATYKVVCNSNLNVRQQASTSGYVLGTLNNGELVEVISIDGQWAEIEYQGTKAYISASYIQQIKEQKDDDTASTFDVAISSDLLDYKNFDKTKILGDTTMVLWVLVPAFILFYIFTKRVDKEGEWSDVRILSIVALVMSALEIVYAMGTQDFLWFCVEPRWYWIAVNFIVFGICTFQQLMAYFTFTGYVSDGKGHLSLYSWPVCLVVGIILYFCDVDPIYAVGLLLLAQLIQTGIIFYTLVKYRNIFSAFVYSFVYLVFTFTTALLLVQFLVLLIIVIIGYFILAAIANGKSSPSQTSSSSSYDNGSNQQNTQQEEQYETPDGVKLHYDGFGDWHDDRGRHYHNTGGWGGREMVRTDED